MRKFDQLTSTIAPLLEAEIDTDVILPARFLLLLEKEGLGEYAFCDKRRIGQQPAFVLDRPEYAQAEILLAGPRFGIGSSREHAVWALADCGIRVIIAPSFGEIFFANCFNNGVLAIVADSKLHAALNDLAESRTLVSIDLEAQEIRAESGFVDHFEIETHNKRALRLGQDKIDAVLAEDQDAIAAFETAQKTSAPWLYLSSQHRDFLNRHLPIEAKPQKRS